jgi:cytochrome P450
MGSIFVALSLYPKVQKKAQEELDRVVGHDRLPSFEDRPNLPYLNAIVTEVFPDPVKKS